MTGFDMSQYLEIFLEEAEEQLQILDEGLVMLEHDKDNKDLLNGIFRAAHTLKGSSASMGFSKIANLTHHMENVLDGFRNGELRVSQEVIDVLLACMDALSELKTELLEEKDVLDVSGLVDRLLALQKGHGTSGGTSETAAAQETFAANPAETAYGEMQELFLNDTEETVAAAAVREGCNLYHITIRLDKECVMKSVRAFIIFNNLKDSGEVLKTIPSSEDIEEERFDEIFEIILISEENPEKIKNIIKSIHEVEEVSIRSILVNLDEEEATLNQKAPAATKDTTERSEKVKTEKRTVSQTVRVDVTRLDNLMNLVGELVIERTRLEAVNEQIKGVIGSGNLSEAMDEISLHIARLSGELQEEIMQARMFPIDQVFNRFPRMIRDLARKFDKEIDFIVEGRETELDRTVIEEIGDPLIHLLRNSVDHGVETKEERLRLGKPVQGRVRLTASHQENQILITVEDDGKGMDPHALRKRAVEKELMSPQVVEKMSDQEAFNLIFLPGFSTANQVSDISGRGVGMDIVRTHIEKINGTVEVDSKKGVGTLFTIRLPLTLAINRSLLLQQCDRIFAIPLSNVVEIIEVDCSETQSMQNSKVALVRNSFLPLFTLEELLGEAKEIPEEGKMPVVVVGFQDKSIGIVVERLVGEQEIVIKSLGGYIGDIHGLAGATIMGDGSVALILDVRGLINSAGVE